MFDKNDDKYKATKMNPETMKDDIIFMISTSLQLRIISGKVFSWWAGAVQSALLKSDLSLHQHGG